MARSRSSSSAKWRYINPAYYLKRPKRLAFLFIAFVFFSLFFWDRQTLVREHEEEISKLALEVTRLQNELEELKNVEGVSDEKTTHTDMKINVSGAKGLPAPMPAAVVSWYAIVLILIISFFVQPSMPIYCNDDDCYDLPGVTQSSNSSEIKKAYYKLSLKHHPDENPDLESKKLFVNIANA